MRFWKIAPGEKGFLWVEQRDNNCIAIGWLDIGDLNEYKTEVAIVKKFSKVYNDSRPSQLLKFYFDVKKGDKVVANSGKWLYGIGEVNGKYKFNEKLYYQHAKPVFWEITFWEPLNLEELRLKGLIRPRLVKRLSLNRTIIELKEEEWKVIRKLASQMRNPFRNLTNWEGLCRAPQTEQEVIMLFSKLSQMLRMKVEFVSTRFPDALIRIKERGDWVIKRAEFEINSFDFKKHDHIHNPNYDLNEEYVIICWRDDWKRKPKNIKVVELKRELERII